MRGAGTVAAGSMMMQRACCQCLEAAARSSSWLCAAAAAGVFQQQQQQHTLTLPAALPFFSARQQSSAAAAGRSFSTSSSSSHAARAPARRSQLDTLKRQASQQLKQQLNRLRNAATQPTNMALVPSAVTAAGGQCVQLSPAQRQDLALLKRFNIAQPYLRNQVILAKVLRCTPKQLLVDPGFYGLNYVPRQELGSAQSYDERGAPILRSPAVIQPGDFVKVRLTAFNTPYGDTQLDPVGIADDVRQRAVWSQLEERMKKGLPVKGRILNATAGGYAVGVAGYVALLQRQQATLQQTRRIGVLQDFYIYQMDRNRKRILLSNMQRQKEDMTATMRATL